MSSCGRTIPPSRLRSVSPASPRGRCSPRCASARTTSEMAAVERMTAAEIIRLLDLKPHPEGGHYRQTFCDRVEGAGRAASTAVYFLLGRGERSHWHSGDA